MVHITGCPLCFSDEIFFHLKVTDHLTDRQEFDLFRCHGCGFIFTQDHPDEQESGRYYESDDYVSHNNEARGVFYKIYLRARYFMLKKKRSIVERVTAVKSGKLLDVGSGTGYFASAMKKAGWQVTGIEPNRRARDFGVERFKLDMISFDQTDSFPGDYFDCITLWHVLEHFHKPFDYVSRLKRIIKPGGFMIIALPNCDSLDSHYYKNFWAAYDVPRHLWHFTPSAFMLFSDRSGLETVEIKRLPLDVFYISILSERYKGSLMPFIKGMLNGLLFSLKSALRSYKCSSLIYVLRKPPDQ